MKDTKRSDYINHGYGDEQDCHKLDNPLETKFVSPSPSCEQKEEPKSQKPVSFPLLFRYATHLERALVFAGIIFGIGTGLCMPFFIILYGEFTASLVDRNMANTTSGKAPLLSLFGGGRILVNGSYEVRMEALLQDSVAFAIGCASTAFLQFVLGVVSVNALNYSAIKQVSRIRRMFLKALLRQNQGWHDINGTTSIANRLTEDLDKLQEGIGEKIGIFMFLVTSFLSSVIMSLIYGWKLTLVVLSCAPIIIVAMAVVAKVQSSLTVKELESYGAAGAVVEEVIGSIRTVVAFGGEKKEVERYTDKLSSAWAMGIKRGLFSGLGGGIFWFIIYCSYSIAFWYGVTLILEDRGAVEKEYTPEILVIVLFGVLAGAMNMGLTAPHLEAFSVARGAAGAIYKTLDQQPEIDSLSDLGLKPSQTTGDIELNDVYFQYPARPEVKVLDGFSLKVARGKTVALVGHSGCGKSTVIQLIQRLYDPVQGTVTLGGVAVKDLNIQWLRGRIGVVGQEPVLFDSTIGENIRNGANNATDKEIEIAAREANAHEFITRLPLGYETMVGERGAQLSGGQKQRVAIARALVRRPAILLLDEATSALDRAGEMLVQSALDQASKGRTTIVVSHRLATIQSADCIVVLSEGKVVEQGTHAELMQLQGHYHKLVLADMTTVQDQGTQKATIYKRNSIPTRERQLSTVDIGNKETNKSQKEVANYPAPFGRIMALNKPEWAHIVVGCIAALMVGCSLPAFAVLFGEVFAILSLEDPDEVRSESNLYSILFVVIAITSGVGTFLQTYVFSIVGVRLTTRLRTDVFDAILQQEVGWFDEENNSVGTLCARLAGDAASVQGATGTRLAVIIQAISTLMIGIIISLYYSWKLTLVSLITIPVVFGAVFIEARVTKGAGLQEKNALEGATKVAVEAISQIRTVASLCGELAILRRYEKELAVAQHAARNKTRLRGVVFAMGQSAPFLCYALTFWYGGTMVATEDMPYQNVIIVGEALIFGAWMLGQSLAYAPSLSTARLSASRLFYLLDRQPLVAAPLTDFDTVKSLEGSVEFSKVEFAYPTRPEVTVLRGLNLLIQPGKTVALVGASGCGKSTCIQLLQRLYDPNAGSLRIADCNIASIPLNRLRRELGIVSQEPVLFDRTIEENIAYGDNERNVPLQEIVAAAEKANIHGFISSLPQGYNTRLGLKGAQLSGGQKQRVAIARALIRNPRILLLDEATSALDTQSEKIVQAALEKAKEGRTCITIAHRLGTIQHADVICVIQQGAVVESGTHADLLALGGHYCQLQRANNLQDA